jgi:hypothetical protein
MRGFFALLWPLLLTSLQVCGGSQMSLQGCEDPTVEATSVTILCDSPSTYYYGQNIHRNSELCSYGDTALITVFFSVGPDLDTNIYMDMGVYAAKNSMYQLLYEVRKSELCQTYVGHQCTTEGTYAFAFKASFTVYDGQDHSPFVPVVSFAFSTKRDDGYDLGGANINCDYTEANAKYVPKYAVKATQQSNSTWGAGGFDSSHGLLLGGVMLLVTAVGFTWWKLGSQHESQQGDSFDLMNDASPRSVV